MTEPQHRKAKRKRGIKFGNRSGRRRDSGAVAGTPPSRADLARSARAADRRTKRRKIIGALLLAFLAVWGAVALSSWLNRTQEPETTPPTAEAAPSEGASMLFVVTAEDGTAASTALITAAEGAATRLTMFQPSLLMTLPGFGENTLANAALFDGVELVDVSIANLLGVRIDGRAALTGAELEAALTGPVEVDVPVPLLEDEAGGQVVAIGAGTGARTPEEIARLMTDRGSDDDVTWLQRQGAAWAGVLQALADDERVLDGLLVNASGDLDAGRRALVAAGDDAIISIAPASRIEPTGGEERYQLDGGDAAQFVADTMPFLALAEEPRTRVEILNGNGQIGTTQPVSDVLVRRGYRVVLTDNADRLDYQVTRIVAQGREHQQAAIDVQGILGVGEVSVEVRQPSGVVDLTIIVGQDLASDGG